MRINAAFLGHGIFTEFSVTNALTRFERYGAPPGSPAPAPDERIDRFIQALADMDIRTVWIQLFSRGGDVEDNDDKRALRKKLIARLGQAGIKWAGWGYCAGKNWNTDKDLIVKFKNDLQMSAFIIDAEPGNRIYVNPQYPNDPDKKLPDLWAEADFDTFASFLAGKFGNDNLAVSTWPILQLQDSAANPVVKLMRIAAPHVCMFAPQAYWMSHPGNAHYKFDEAHFTVENYPRNDPVALVRLVLEAWRVLNFAQPLVISGQTYWELEKDGGSPSRETMETKIYQFAKHFTDWPKIIGFNWYHAGLKVNSEVKGAMSDDMVAYIKGGQFGTKPYKPA